MPPYVLIGCGQRGWGYVRYFAAAPGLNLTCLAVHDVDPAQLAHFQAQCHERLGAAWTAVACAQLEELAPFLGPDVLLLVCAADAAHLAVVAGVAPYHAGGHAVLEKPVALSVSEWFRLERVRRQARLTLHVPFVLRFVDLFQTARAALRARLPGGAAPWELGLTLTLTPEHLASFQRRAPRGTPGWVHLVRSKLCHDLDLLRWLVDSPIVHLRARALRWWGPATEPRPAAAAARCGDCAVADCPWRGQGRYFLPHADRVRDACVWPARDPMPDALDVDVLFQRPDATARLLLRCAEGRGNRVLRARRGGEALIEVDYRAGTVEAEPPLGAEVPPGPRSALLPARAVGHRNGDLCFVMAALARMGTEAPGVAWAASWETTRWTDALIRQIKRARTVEW